MIPTSKSVTPTLRTMQWCTAVAAAYILLIFVLPGNHATMDYYHLSAFGYRVVNAALAMPTIAVWFAAFWGYAKLREYSRAIAKSREGPHFARLASGCAWLAWSLPVTTLSSFLLNGIANKWPAFHPSAIIISNYCALVLPLIAFITISLAAREMIGKSRLNLGLTSTRLMMAFFLVGGLTYCFFIFRHFDLTSLASTHNPYFLPVWLMIISVIIPSLYAWFIGLLAAYEISLFGANVHGLLYRRALLYMVSGLVAVLLSSIALQYISSVVPRAGDLLFDYRLLLILVVRIVGGVGFFVLAIGANRLKKIEEV
jgi:hypothetical protein